MQMSYPPRVFDAPTDFKDAVDVDVFPESVDDSLRCCLDPGE